MIPAALIAVAAALIPAVMAGSPCVSNNSQCQWTNCGVYESPSSQYTRVVTSTEKDSRNTICQKGNAGNPGDECCANYGSGCVFGHRKLWCEEKNKTEENPKTEDKKLVSFNPSDDPPRAKQYWSNDVIQSDKDGNPINWAKLCREAGGKVVGDSRCKCEGGKRWGGSKCRALW